VKNGRFQAKDIDDRFFLRCVDWARWERNPPVPFKSQSPGFSNFPHWVFTWNLACLMPAFEERLIVAKAAQLKKRGLVDGCCCGCRGDFELTPAGEAFLGADLIEVKRASSTIQPVRTKITSIENGQKRTAFRWLTPLGTPLLIPSEDGKTMTLYVTDGVKN
jgi:hypothetical protein